MRIQLRSMLLYAVFITSSEHATIAELASTLQADISKLEAAVSLAARLGWARKRVDPEELLHDMPGSPGPDDLAGMMTSSRSLGGNYGESSSGDLSMGHPGVTRFALLVDANLTSYIMMGSLSPGLKGHAVNLYEAGKLGDSHVAEMCKDLRKVEASELEGELEHFAHHAFSLQHVLECLRSGGTGILDDVSLETDDIEDDTPSATKKVRVDVVRCESLSGLAPATIQRVFRRDYDIIVSMIPLPSLPAVICPAESGPVHFGASSRAAMTPWMKLLLYTVAEAGPVSIALVRGQRLRLLPASLSGCFRALIWTWDGIGIGGAGGKFEGTLVEGGVLLHVINSLLKHSAVLVQPYGEESFDVGRRVELATEDVALPLCKPKSSDVLGLQRASKELHFNTMGYVRLVRILKTAEADTVTTKEPAWDWVPQSVEFGVPLFNTTLCKLVCEGVVKCGLFDADALARHHRKMADLHSKLQEFIADYQADGPVSRLAYSVVQSPDGITAPDMFSPGSTSAARSPQLTRLQSDKGNVEAGDAVRTYTLSVGEDQFSPSPKAAAVNSVFLESSSEEEVPLPGVNLIFNGSWLAALDISACLQGRLPASLLLNNNQ